MGKFNPPESFDFSKPQLWTDWRKRWVRYHTATELSNKSQAVQVSSLIYAMGQKAEAIYKTFEQVEDGAPLQDQAQVQDPETHDAILKKFDRYFIPM